MKLIVTLIYLSVFTLCAETVTWKVSGTVNSASGGFSTSGISAGQDVEVEFSYDSEAGYHVTATNVFAEDRDYFDEINLNVSVKINGQTWSGTLGSGINNSLPRTFFTTDAAGVPITEKVYCTLEEEDGASMTSFPQSLGGGKDKIHNLFNGVSQDPEFVNGGIGVNQINASKAGSATGVIHTVDTSGVEQNIFYTLDVSTLTIMGEQPPPATPEVSISLTGDLVTLTWQSEVDVIYCVDASETLMNFAPVEFVSGDGTVLSVTVAKTYEKEFFRVVAIPDL